MVEKKALTAAPMPIEDCADIEATACPMKYASGMIDRSAMGKRNAGLVIQDSIPSALLRMRASKMTKTTTARKLIKKIFVPSTVYFQYFMPTARYVQIRIEDGFVLLRA